MSRKAVLTLLRQREGDYVSGEELAQKLGLSRAAVWKAVDVLRSSGYEIEARTGLGYRLLAAPDVLSEGEIRQYLGTTEAVGRELRCFDTIDSTNTYIRQIAMEGAPDGTVAVANQQTGGRGRMGRSFQSPRDKGIYLTALLRPDLPPERLLPVTALAGVAVCDAVEEVCGIRPGIKWPNDPVLGGKKLCGILTELSMEAETGAIQSLALGIGLNVHQTPADFSPDVAEMATSLDQALGTSASRPEVAAAMIRALDRMYEALRKGELRPYLEALRQDCVNLGRLVQLILPNGSREVAEAIGIDEEFGLVIRDESGAERVIRSGEVSVRGMYGYVE